jgi:hypothetical protein
MQAIREGAGISISSLHFGSLFIAVYPALTSIPFASSITISVMEEGE